MQSRTAAREVIASYDRYEDAQRAVDALADRDFDVAGLAIEGRGLRVIERVTGPMNYGRAALQGAASGAMIGLLFGLIFGLLNWFAPAESALVLGLYGVLIGAFWGAILGLLGQWLTRGARDFESVSATVADTYDVTAPLERAAEARRVLSELGLSARTP
jgi:uncharacterized YccA/Bax inhibitor family protein